MMIEKTEKKVEYLELIYDLIFVYIVGRNNSLLHVSEGGFVEGRDFLAYVLCTLAVIQIWNFSTYYINMHGRNGLRDHVFLLINMYLLYYIGEGTHRHWQSFQNQYHMAWALILINIGIQYVIESRNHRQEPDVVRQIMKMAIVLFGEAAIVLTAIPLYNYSDVVLAPAAILFGVAGTILSSNKRKSEIIDFAHLSERAMLYVVFTFGEMIIVIASYFEGELTGSSLYFSAMAFLIVVALFLSYEALYDHIIDREMKTNGIFYLIFHIFLVFALNNISASLEFMREENVDLLPKIIFLTASLLLFYICMLLITAGFAKKRLRPDWKFILAMVAAAAAFTVLMLVFREKMYVNIAVTVLFAFGVFIVLLTIRRTANGTCRKIQVTQPDK